MTESSDSRTPKPKVPKPAAPVPKVPQASIPERYRVAGADFLAQDTWADDPETCPQCGADVASGDARCGKCGQWLERCSGSCPSCASPVCVGGKRKG